MIEVITDEDALHVQLDVRSSVSKVRRARRRSIWDIEEGGELYISFSLEVGPVQRLKAILIERRIKLCVLFVRNIGRLSGPERLHRVHLNPIPNLKFKN